MTKMNDYVGYTYGGSSSRLCHQQQQQKQDNFAHRPPPISELQRLEFKEAFQEFDKDGSGTISTKELLPVLRSIGQNPTEDEILSLVVEFDVNGDGTIDFDEFLEMMSRQAAAVDQTAEIREAFKIFDRDGNGFIDTKELKQVVTQLGQVLTKAEADEFMREADQNGDGKLDYEEFVNMMMQHDQY